MACDVWRVTCDAWRMSLPCALTWDRLTVVPVLLDSVFHTVEIMTPVIHTSTLGILQNTPTFQNEPSYLDKTEGYQVWVDLLRTEICHYHEFPMRYQVTGALWFQEVLYRENMDTRVLLAKCYNGHLCEMSCDLPPGGGATYLAAVVVGGLWVPGTGGRDGVDATDDHRPVSQLSVWCLKVNVVTWGRRTGHDHLSGRHGMTTSLI